MICRGPARPRFRFATIASGPGRGGHGPAESVGREARVVLLILVVVLGLWQAILGSALTTAVGLGTWYALPLASRRSRPDLPAEPRRRRYRPRRNRTGNAPLTRPG